jgi:hypothetical protein
LGVQVTADGFMVSDVWRLELLLFIGLLFKGVGFLGRSELSLRTMVLVGLCFDVAYLALRVEPVLPVGPALAVTLLAVLLIGVMVLRARTTLGMSPREKRLFVAFQTLTPGQFRRVWRLGQSLRTHEETVIIREGEQLGALYYVEGFRFDVRKSGARAEAKGPAFSGEIGFLTGNRASADVILPPGTPYIQWSEAELHALMRRNPALKNALIARFSLDLAVKVARSIPITQAPTTPRGGAE